MKETEKRYVLTGDGYTGRHGTKLYLLGVFDDKEEAEKMAKEHKCAVTEIEANKFFQLVETSHECKENEHYLGGYVE